MSFQQNANLPQYLTGLPVSESVKRPFVSPRVQSKQAEPWSRHCRDSSFFFSLAQSFETLCEVFSPILLCIVLQEDRQPLWKGLLQLARRASIFRKLAIQIPASSTFVSRASSQAQRQRGAFITTRKIYSPRNVRRLFQTGRVARMSPF